jgi:hypothetical protein
MRRIFGGVRAPSTCGTFLRTFTFGHVLQLQPISNIDKPGSASSGRWSPCVPVIVR